MVWSQEELRRIYDRTSGKCHICGKKLALKNYATFDARGAWEVEHSVAKIHGGTDHGNNLFSACISCNRSKSTASSRTARKWAGRTRSPMSKAEQDRKRNSQAWTGGTIGVLIGWLFGGPFLAMAVGLASAGVGHSIDPE